MNRCFIKLFPCLAVILIFAACNRVQWATTRQLCGRIQIIDNQSQMILKDSDITLYRSKSESVRCCSLAENVATMRTDANGNFNFGKLSADRYFVVIKNSPQISFPVYLETSYGGGKCSMDPVFSFDRRTGKTELTETVLVPTN